MGVWVGVGGWVCVCVSVCMLDHDIQYISYKGYGQKH